MSFIINFFFVCNLLLLEFSSCSASPALNYSCDPVCDEKSTSFCGSDGKCHPYTCHDWFVFGPPSFTVGEGEQPTSMSSSELSGLLNCRSLSEDEPDTNFFGKYPYCEFGIPLAAVAYAKRESQDLGGSEFCKEPHSNDSEDSPTVALSFDQKCTAEIPDSDDGFICYDVTDEAMITSYVEEASVLDPNTTSFFFNTNLAGFFWTTEIVSNDGGDDIVLNIENRISYENFDAGTENLWDPSRLPTILMAERSSLFKQNPPISQGDKCEEGCPNGFFCGKDASCHPIGDCEVYFQHGPPYMTGLFNKSIEISLNCTKEYQNNFSHDVCNEWTGLQFEPEWPIAVNFDCERCGSITFESDSCSRDYRQGRELPFSRMCTAKPNEDQSFVCFDMVGVLDDDILNYERKIIENGDCSAESVESLQADEVDTMDHQTLYEPDDISSDNCFYAWQRHTSQISNRTYQSFLYPYQDSNRNLLGENTKIDRVRLNFLMLSDLRGISNLPELEQNTSTVAPDEKNDVTDGDQSEAMGYTITSINLLVLACSLWYSLK